MKVVAKCIKKLGDVYTMTLVTRTNENYAKLTLALIKIARDGFKSNMTLDAKSKSYLWMSVLDGFGDYNFERQSYYELDIKTVENYNGTHINFRIKDYVKIPDPMIPEVPDKYL